VSTDHRVIYIGLLHGKQSAVQKAYIAIIVEVSDRQSLSRANSLVCSSARLFFGEEEEEKWKKKKKRKSFDVLVSLENMHQHSPLMKTVGMTLLAQG
jgi:hypothetical protein